MTNKEAIHELKNLKGYGQIFFTEMDMPNNLIHMSQALDKGIEALEDQKIMQVELEGDGYADGELIYDFGKCPKCGWDFEEGDKDWEEPYCCHCGQKLHWFD